MLKRPQHTYEYMRFLQELKSEDNSKIPESWKRPLAQKMMLSQPLPQKKNCHFCYRTEDLLTPITLKICKNCMRTFLKRIDKMKTLNVEYYIKGFYCQWCFGKGYRIFTINPHICDKCMNRMKRRIGRR